MMRNLALITLLAAGTVLSGCTPNIGGSDYSVSGVGEMSTTLRGVIVSARPVKINNKRAEQQGQPGAGAALGGLGGAALGSTIGGGAKAHTVGAVGVGILGAVAGHLIEQKMSEQEGIEYQVQLDRGDLITMAQGAEPRMSPGQRVLVVQSTSSLNSGGRDRGRVIPDNSYGPAPAPRSY